MDHNIQAGIKAVQAIGELQVCVIKSYPEFMEELRYRLKNELKINYRHVLAMKDLVTKRVEQKIS